MLKFLLRACQFALAVTLLTAATTATAQKSKIKEGIVEVPTGEPRMEAAIKRAKQTYPYFLKRFSMPAGAKNFTVKLAYDTVAIGKREHIWASDIKRDGNKLTASIANTPHDIPNLIAGQRVTIDPAMVSDWGFVRDGKMHGYYTVRAVLQFMPTNQAKFYRGILAPPR